MLICIWAEADVSSTPSCTPVNNNGHDAAAAFNMMFKEPAPKFSGTHGSLFFDVRNILGSKKGTFFEKNIKHEFEAIL